ncbi:PQQ-binding-like beta-propeller repeat protein [Natrinema sp. 74]|uniref:outer membrane protein assembly factor BamB family protein n=1 Tax=Natrinema sp. 74 TaxID=3384159 RepID=UPI0038D3538D
MSATSGDEDGSTDVAPRPPEAATDWSTARCGPGRTGAVGFSDGFGEAFEFDALETDWTTDAEALPVVADGTAYLSVEGAVRALDTADGSLEWQCKGIGAHGQPTVAYGTVYARCDNTVVALDAATGAVQWETTVADAADDTVASPTVAFGTVYVFTEECLTAIDCKTGAVEWTRSGVELSIGDPWEEPETVSRSLERNVVADDDRIYAIAEKGTIVGLDPLTGDLDLTIKTNYYYLYDLVVAGGRVFVRTQSEVVAAYDSETCERVGIWYGGIRRIAVRDETLVFVTRYELVAIDLESGEERWSVGKYSHAIGDPVIACDTVFVSIGLQGGQYENSLVAFDIDDGSERWVRQRTGSAYVGERCVVADRTVYIDDGGLTAIRVSSDDGGDGDDSADDQPQPNTGDAADDETHDDGSDVEEPPKTDARDAADDVQEDPNETADGGQHQASIWTKLLSLCW